jgi:hypothetical protein
LYRSCVWYRSFERGEHLEPNELYAPEEPAYSPDGVDLTLIRWMLSLTPAERLEVLQGFVDSVEEIRARNRKA